jgi:hypothetical protein
MYLADSFVIRHATDADDVALARLASLDSQPRLEGSILMGELNGEPVAALSLADDRAIADPFRPTADLVATMRVRARGLHAVEHMPPLRDRLLAGLRTSYRGRLAGRAA